MIVNIKKSSFSGVMFMVHMQTMVMVEKIVRIKVFSKSRVDNMFAAAVCVFL